MVAQSVLRPVHCRPTHDCTDWARDPRRSQHDHGHSQWVHAEREVFLTQLWAWIDRTLTRIRHQQSIATLDLPNPSNPQIDLGVGMVDPSTVLIILGIGQRAGHEANGIYVGFVGQDPNCLWRGLTGFFLPWCPGCDADGNTTLRSLQRALRERDVMMTSAWDLPVDIQPQDGWFDGDRLMLGGRVHTLPGVTDYWRRADASLREPALVATGPVTTSLSNLILLDGDVRHLTELRPHPSRWTVRTGSAATLSTLAGIASTTPHINRGHRRPTRIPAAWGSFCDQSGTWHGPFPNLRRTATEWATTQPEPTSSLSFMCLPEGVAVRLSDVLQLGRNRT